MGGSSKIIGNREARERAQQQRVYISGLHGQHSLETGLAYFYRGHFIYAYPAGNPIEPIAYSTRRGISIVGIAVNRAPRYDPLASNLVAENSIGALQKARKNQPVSQLQQEEEQKSETPQILEQNEEDLRAKSAFDNTKQVDIPHVHVSFAKTQSESHIKSTAEPSAGLLQPLLSVPYIPSFISPASLALHSLASSTADIPNIVTAQAPSMSSVPAYAPQTLPAQMTYTPHDRAQFFAYSAPVSRHVSATNTPHTSRPASPSEGLASHGLLRTVASASRLSHLLAEEEMRRAFSPLERVSEGRGSRAAASTVEYEYESDLFAEDMETSSQKMSKKDPFLPGLGHIEQSAQPREIRSVSAFPAIRPSRPQSPSLALNQACGAANPTCPIHGKTCDGKTTTELRLTERARLGPGFKEDYPVVTGSDGGVVVDWLALCEEERTR